MNEIKEGYSEFRKKEFLCLYLVINIDLFLDIIVNWRI